MISDIYLTKYDLFHKQAKEYLVKGDYDKAARLYEEAIEIEPTVKSNYWNLGLILLLQGKKEEAEATWLVAMIDGEVEQVALWNYELTEILKAEALRRQEINDHTTAYLLRCHILEIQPKDINNLLNFIYLSIEINTFTGDNIANIRLIGLLQERYLEDTDINLLIQVLQKVLDYDPIHPKSLELAKACLPYLKHLPRYFAVILVTAINVAYGFMQPSLAVEIAQLCLEINSEDIELLRHLTAFYQSTGDYVQAIEMARKCCSLLENSELADKAYANHLLLRTLITSGGHWQEASKIIQHQDNLLNSIIKNQENLDDGAQVSRLLLSTFFYQYFRDEPEKNRQIQNQLASLCQWNLQNNAQEQADWYKQQQHIPNRKINNDYKRLRIGYISNCFRQHSVGWLARWLFQYHDRERFELYGYFVSYKQRAEPLQEWYFSQFDKAHKMGIDSEKIAKTINQDEIDILVDLDSLTLDITCEVMALKPAQIQITWLGWDASGIPSIDYYIADPYVLPNDAQNYYSEKIWRLPQTYIAVDGFEVGVPNIRREDLNIESDAVVYLSSQGGCKRHPDTVRLQMKILKAVPNSYFLIKGLGDQEAIKKFFIEIAATEGVESNRLRFLPEVPSEAIHRANLSIADVVLDTYPYNGATTTLETLWMGIPLVTKVGKQFAARNSYTMMMNAGISEGIAWSDKEYVDWGIRLGKETDLRQKVGCKLRQSRYSSPLWNAEKFTREMENAYEEMWQIWVKANVQIKI